MYHIHNTELCTYVFAHVHLYVCIHAHLNFCSNNLLATVCIYIHSHSDTACMLNLPLALNSLLMM